MSTQPQLDFKQRAKAWLAANRRTLLGIVAPALLAITTIVLLSIFAPAMSGPWWQWTGFGPNAATPPAPQTQDYQPPKTLWEWLDLLLVPAIISFGGLWFTSRESRIQAHLQDVRTQDSVLQSYFDQMTELLLEKGLRTPNSSDDVRIVARSRTIAALRLLDGSRKSTVLRFLQESGVINCRAACTLNLLDADFSQIDMRGVDLNYASLRGVSLAKANLQATSLRWADLSEADLYDAKLADADLAYANFRRARTNANSTLSRKWRLVYGLQNMRTDQDRRGMPSLHGEDLSGADLRKLNLHGLDLGAADLTGADLRFSILEHMPLSSTLLNQADLYSATLSGAILRDASLRGANLRQADLTRADMSGADLTGTSLALAKMVGAVIDSDTELDAKWRTVYDLQNRSPGAAAPVQPAQLARRDLSDAYLMGCSLRGADLREADLSGADLRNADLRNADLRNADLRRAQLLGANFSGANLLGANLRQVGLFGVILDAAQLDPKWQLVRQVWGDALPNLERADLAGVNLNSVDLTAANLRNADLRGADLAFAILRRADLRGADLRGANLLLAELADAQISPDTRMDAKWRLAWSILQQGDFNRDLHGADLEGAYLREANLRGANLQGANLRGADLRGADLRGADLRGADVREALFSAMRYDSQTILPEGSELWESQTSHEA